MAADWAEGVRAGPHAAARRYGVALDGTEPPGQGETLADLRAACVAEGCEERARWIEGRAHERVQEWAALDIMREALGVERWADALLESATRLLSGEST